MKSITLAIVLFTLTSAKGSRECGSLYDCLLRSSNLWATSGQSEKDFLTVCDPRSKNTEREIKEILETAGDNFRKLAEAMDQDDLPKVLTIIRNCQQYIEKKVSALEGTIFAVVKANKGTSIPASQARCANGLLIEFKILYDTLKEVQTITTQVTRDFKQQTGDIKFYNLQKEFDPLIRQIQQFIEDPKSVRPLQATCKANWKETNIESIIENLNTFISNLKPQNKELKGQAAESATGLLAQALTLNAVCNSVKYVSQTEETAFQKLENDIKLSKKAVNDLEPVVEMIVGLKNFFRRFFGY